MIIHRQSKEQVNSIIISLFIYQYSLTIPLMSRISPTIVIGISSSILICCLLFYNKRASVNTLVIYFLLLIAGLFALKTIVDLMASPDLLIHFAFFVIPSSIMMMFRYDSEKLLETCYKLAIINFVVLFSNPFLSSYRYMRFGYGMILTPVFILQYIPRLTGKKKIVSLAVMFISFAEVFLYGSRGCLIVFVLFFGLYSILIQRERIIRNISLIIAATALFLNIEKLIDLAYRISLLIGLGSYSIAKYRMQLANGWAYASSGRDRIYQDSIEKIRQHPIIGNVIETIGEDDYVHNLFLQVAKDFGIPIMLVMVVFLIVIILKIADKKFEYNNRVLLCCLFSVSVGRLLFSSTLYKRPEFWLMLFMFCSLKRKRDTMPELSSKTS